VTAAHPELGYRIALGVINALFAIAIVPLMIILGGPLLYVMGV
jgi:hypothetical protein